MWKRTEHMSWCHAMSVRSKCMPPATEKNQFQERPLCHFSHTLNWVPSMNLFMHDFTMPVDPNFLKECSSLFLCLSNIFLYNVPYYAVAPKYARWSSLATSAPYLCFLCSYKALLHACITLLLPWLCDLPRPGRCDESVLDYIIIRSAWCCTG